MTVEERRSAVHAGGTQCQAHAVTQQWHGETALRSQFIFAPTLAIAGCLRRELIIEQTALFAEYLCTYGYAVFIILVATIQPHEREVVIIVYAEESDAGREVLVETLAKLHRKVIGDKQILGVLFGGVSGQINIGVVVAQRLVCEELLSVKAKLEGVDKTRYGHKDRGVFWHLGLKPQRCIYVANQYGSRRALRRCVDAQCVRPHAVGAQSIILYYSFETEALVVGELCAVIMHFGPYTVVHGRNLPGSI